jgi:O-antigen ligase
VNRYHPVAESLPPRVIKDIESVTFAHSSYVLVLAEQGLFGFVPFALMTFATWRLIRALRRVPATPDADLLGSAALGAGFAYLVMSLTLTMIPYSPSNCFFAMLLGLVAGALEDESATTEAVTTR